MGELRFVFKRSYDWRSGLILTAYSSSLSYQFWIHADWFPKLGPLTRARVPVPITASGYSSLHPG